MEAKVLAAKGHKARGILLTTLGLPLMNKSEEISRLGLDGFEGAGCGW